MTAKRGRVASGTGSSDSMREAREAEVESKVHKYMVELADKRKQAGIISTPSTELLEAERRLAEVYTSTIVHNIIDIPAWFMVPAYKVLPVYLQHSSCTHNPFQ